MVVLCHRPAALFRGLDLDLVLVAQQGESV
jgi:hypothetical protein